MTMQRTAEEAMQVVANAQERVIQQGGVIHEESMWDASEMALDGVSTGVIVKTLKQSRPQRYVPRGSWSER